MTPRSTASPAASASADPRPNADPGDHEISLDRAAAFELHLFAVDGGRHVLEVENHAVLLMQRADEIAHLRAENPLHGPFVRRHHMDVESASAERRRDLEPNEARTHDDRRSRRLGIVDDRFAVGERAQRVHMRLVGAGDR